MILEVIDGIDKYACKIPAILMCNSDKCTEIKDNIKCREIKGIEADLENIVLLYFKVKDSRALYDAINTVFHTDLLGCTDDNELIYKVVIPNSSMVSKKIVELKTILELHDISYRMNEATAFWLEKEEVENFIIPVMEKCKISEITELYGKFAPKWVLRLGNNGYLQPITAKDISFSDVCRDDDGNITAATFMSITEIKEFMAALRQDVGWTAQRFYSDEEKARTNQNTGKVTELCEYDSKTEKYTDK